MNGPPRPALRLVHPAKPRESRPKLARIEERLFSEEERRLLKANLKTARGLLGSWACLADAMRVAKTAVQRAASPRGRVSPAIAICLSRALGVPLEVLIRPGLRLVPFPKVCPTCGKG